MNFIKKLFSKIALLRKNKPSNMEFNLKWIASQENDWGVRLLDLRPISETMISASENTIGAKNALSYFKEDGSSFINERPATNISFKTKIRISITKSLEEGALFIPQSMENKWAIFYKNDKIIVVRGWQRKVFIIAKVEVNSNNILINEIHGKIVNPEEPEDFTKSALTFLIYTHVLNKSAPVPIPEDLMLDTNVAGLWVFKNFGNLADLGYVGWDFDYSKI